MRLVFPPIIPKHNLLKDKKPEREKTMKRISKEEREQTVIKKCDEHKCSLIEIVSINSHYHCRIQCIKHSNIMTMQYVNFMNKQGLLCDLCEDEKTFSKLVCIIESKGGMCLSEEYKRGKRKPIHVECKNSHVFETNGEFLVKGYWCQECQINNMKVTKHENRVESMLIGDDLEKYVYDIFIKYYETEMTGWCGDIFDLIVTTSDNIQRGIQVKKLSKVYGTINSYKLRCEKTYPNNTLMVYINQEDCRFAVFLCDQSIKNSSITFSDRVSYKSIKLFEDPKDFRQYILTVVKGAFDISNMQLKDRFYKTNLKEYLSIQRVKEFCIKHNLEYKPNYTRSSFIDFYIKGKAIQHKFSLYRRNNRYEISLYKKKNKKPVPYHIDDEIDFFLIEIGDYLSEFCLLPIDEMIKEGYIETKDQKGKKVISIFHYDTTSKRPNFTKDPKYWGENILKFLQT